MLDPVSVWMRRIQDADGFYGPDRPDTVAYSVMGGHPRNMVDPKVTPWASEFINCYIERDDLEKCKDYIIDPKDVSDKDKLMVAMIRACQDNWEMDTEPFFATIPNLSTGNAALKQIAKELLEQAKPRGLSDTKAEAIRNQYSLPALSSIQM